MRLASFSPITFSHGTKTYPSMLYTPPASRAKLVNLFFCSSAAKDGHTENLYSAAVILANRETPRLGRATARDVHRLGHMGLGTVI